MTNEQKLADLYALYTRLCELDEQVANSGCNNHEQFTDCGLCGENGEWARTDRRYKALAEMYVDGLMFEREEGESRAARMEMPHE